MSSGSVFKVVMFHWVADLFHLNGFPAYLFCWKSLELQLSTMCNGAYQFEDAELLNLSAEVLMISHSAGGWNGQAADQDSLSDL